jgi:CRISPR/Cas system-associated exonuclease Cas4 (RecB family)
MQNFLDKLSQHILNKHANELGNVQIVLPSRRARVFLTDYFKQHIQQNSWLPEIYSLEDFVKELSQLTVLDNIDLVFKLYDTHQKIEGSKAEALEDFLSWANTLLQDFNEVDRYLVSSEELYTFLSEAKAIENWNLGNEELSEFQKNYLHFWRKLGDYYKYFSKQLLDENAAYQGLAFRKLAEDLKANKVDYATDKVLYFAGFNALTLAEEQIIQHFIKNHKAQILWDADEYYLSDTNQEAGLFLRDYQKKFKTMDWTSSQLLKGEKEINIYSISGDIGQAKLIGELVSQKQAENTLKNTAIVLGDEDLLMPVLESLPKSVERINVTMGYALNHSIFYHFFESLIDLHFKQDKMKGGGFYFKDIIRFLEQPAIQHIHKGLSNQAKILLDKIKEERLIYLHKKEMQPLEDQLDVKIFNLGESTAAHLNRLMLQLCEQIKSHQKGSLSPLEKEFLFGFYRAFNRIDALCEKYNSLKSFDSLLQLYRQILSTESVAFVGEPLGGLQLMGVLESRTLDFEQLIFSSLNEGILPAGKSQNSFIPFDIKKKFGLPSYREKDAIFAYHFYRMLQRSKRIDLIYNSKVDQLKGGERSRFVDQLIYEMPKKNPKVKINQIHLAPPLDNSSQEEVEITKSEEHLKSIRAHLSRGLSPSALNSYLQCPLNYYYKYILGMKEEQIIEEKIENHTFGTVIHDSLEALYKPHINQVLDQKSIQSIKAQINDEVKRQYEKNLNLIPESGSHRLAYEVAKRLVENTIEVDEKAIEKGDQIQLIALEQKVAWETEIKINDEQRQKVILKGKIDRIDRKNNKLRIIDYKSGKVEHSALSYKDLDSLTNGGKSVALQMLLYQLMYENKHSEEAEAGVISMRNIKSGFLKLNPKDENDALDVLKIVINDLLNPNAPFKHNEKSIYCAFC